MGIDEGLISPVNTKIHAFDGSKVTPIGTIALLVYAANRALMVTYHKYLDDSKCNHGTRVDLFDQRGSFNFAPGPKMSIPR